MPLGPRPEVGGGSWFRLLRKGSKRLACGLAYGLGTGGRGDGRSQGASIPRRVWLPVPAFPPKSCWHAGWLSFAASLVALPLLAGEASAITSVELKVAKSSNRDTDNNSIILEDAGTVNLAVTAYGLETNSNKRTQNPVTINYTLGGTATPGQDYTIGRSINLDYAAGTGQIVITQNTQTRGKNPEATVNLPITIINDTVIDAGETIIVTLDGEGRIYDVLPSKGAVTLTTYEASTPSVSVPTKLVRDDDFAGTLFKAVSEVEVFEHGGRVQDASISLSETLSEDLTIRYVLGGTATPGVDYTIRGFNYGTGRGTIRIPAGTLADEPILLPIEIINDRVSDDGETIVVTILKSSDYSYLTNIPRQLTVTINEQAGRSLTTTPPPVVSWGTTNAFAVEDQGTQTVGIQVNELLSADLTINYTLRGTATPGVDYTIAGANPMTRMGTFIIPAGTPAATSVDFPIAILNDGISDDGETILLTIASGSNYNPDSESEFLRMTIQESGGPATVSWNRMGGNTLTVLRDGGTHNLPLAVSQPLSADLTINYTLTGTAIQGEDYTIAGADRDEEEMFTGTGTFTIPAGTPRSVNVDFPIHILFRELGGVTDKTINLTIEKGSGYEVGNGLFRLTISEEGGSSGLFRIRGIPRLHETLKLPHDLPDIPPGGGVAIVTMKLQNLNPACETIYTTYIASRGSYLGDLTALELSTFEVSLTPQSLCNFFQTPDNRLINDYVGFEIAYIGQNGLTTRRIATEWLGPIQPTTASKASFTAASASVKESMGTHQVVVDLNPVPTSAFTLNYTVSGTATAGAGNDFTIPNSGKVQVPAGASTVSIPVSIVNDMVEEGRETVVLTLEPGDHHVLSTDPPPIHTITIIDAEGEVSWGTTTLSVVEGGGTQTMGIHVNQPLAADLNIDYTLRGTATPGEDYTIAGANYKTRSGTFTIPSGTPPFTRVAFPIAILNDSIRENDETIILTITSSPNYNLGNLDRATVTICEQACERGAGPTMEPVASFASPSASLEESMGPHQVIVNLNPAPTSPLILNYTVGGTATAGAGNDFTIPNSGRAPVAAGAASVTIPVTIIDDNTPELDETVVLTLAAGTGYGLGTPNTPHTLTITDTDTDTEEKTDHKSVKKAWHLRFGRTLSHQVADGLQDRLSAPPTALGLQLTVAGETITSPTPLAEQEGLLSKALGFEAVTPQALAEGSSFSLASGQGPGGTRPQLAFWGHGAFSSFNGEEDELSLDGDVTTVLLGADWTTDQWRAGAALSQSWGSGSYEDDKDAEGEISNTVTGVFPYGRYTLTPRLGVWATAGYGWGELSFQPDGEDEYTPSTTMIMGALGMDGVLLDGGDEGITLSSTADVLTMKTSSEDVDGLDSSEGSVSRLRLGIEAARPFPLASGASLLPSMEVGIRQDSGDAETGFGLDLGAGLTWSDPQHGISGALKGHTLLAHGEKDFQEQGLAFSFSWSTPSNRGPSLSLNHTMGAAPSGGTDALLNLATMEGLEAVPSNGQQFEAELAYGLPVYNNHLSFTPALALALSPASKNYSVLWSLAPYAEQAQADPWEISLEGERQEQNTATSSVEHSLKLRFSTLF